jgi:signal transduction histidine kinase
LRSDFGGGGSGRRAVFKFLCVTGLASETDRQAAGAAAAAASEPTEKFSKLAAFAGAFFVEALRGSQEKQRGRFVMAGKQIAIAPERIAETKQLYELTQTPAEPPAPALADASADEAELRRANAVHIQHTVATSLAAIDGILAKAGPADESGIERSARTLAAVARALQEMSAMTTPEDETPQDEFDDDDLLPRDIEDIRAELAERLHALIDAETGCGGSDRDAGDPGAAATGR